jgi:predicted transcriptional regulator
MKISKEKKDKISEQILAFLYSTSPKPIFTYHIAEEIARDEEFVKKLLLELKGRNLVIEVKKNPKGKQYVRRSRWKLSDAVYEAYRGKQPL